MKRLGFVVSLLSILGLAAATGCGDDGGTHDHADAAVSAPDANSNTVDAGGGSPDANNAGFTTLISRAYTIPAGAEFYRCAALTATEDIYINTFRALSPLGTHHTVVAVEDTPTRADGEYDCNASALGHTMLFASGVGTDDLAFPSGVGIKVSAGQQIFLNLHLYNTSDASISGEAGALVKTITAAELTDEAEMVFGGTFQIFLTGTSTAPQTVTGKCSFPQAATVVALWPHMHQLGTHMKVSHNGTTILDEAFDFNEQYNYPMANPLQVAAGEKLDVECTYVNTTGGIVTFGDSSSMEMCFAGIYRYPATGAGVFDCIQN